MQRDDIAIRVLSTPDAEPTFDVDQDSKVATFVYAGDPLELLRLGIAAGRVMGRGVLPMKTITLPE